MIGAGGLAGTTWVVAALDGRPVPAAGGPAVLTFGADGRLAGLGGVNRFSGPYAVRGGELVAGPLMSTRRGGPPEWMAVEARLLQILARPVRVAPTADGMELGEGEVALTAARARPA